MARKRRRGRGITVGTILILAFSVITLLAAGAMLSRLSGGRQDAVPIDPKLTEQLTSLTRVVTESGILSAPDGEALPAETTEMATAQQTAAPTPRPARLLITAAGQIGTGTELRAAARQQTTYNFDSMLAPISGALSADLSIATLRASLTADSAAFDAYNAPDGLGGSLKRSGIQVVNLATDRLFDHGMAGVTQTLSTLSGLQLTPVGAHANESAHKEPVLLTVQGHTIGILAYTGPISAAGREAATEGEIAATTRLLDPAAAARDIAQLRTDGAELIIVLAHWGNRSDQRPSAETEKIATALAEAGADIILGTGPTTIHPVERRTVLATDGTAREVFIAYSLGNLLIDESRDTGDITGLVLGLTIEWDGQAGPPRFGDCWYMPTWIMRWRDSGVMRYAVVPAGANSIPAGMTDSVYANMHKAYQSVLNKLGNEAAAPRAEP